MCCPFPRSFFKGCTKQKIVKKQLSPAFRDKDVLALSRRKISTTRQEVQPVDEGRSRLCPLVQRRTGEFSFLSLRFRRAATRLSRNPRGWWWVSQEDKSKKVRPPAMGVAIFCAPERPLSSETGAAPAHHTVIERVDPPCTVMGGA